MRNFFLLFAVLVSITINSINAQITNGSFESWSGTNPDGWVGPKTHTTGLTITKVTTDAHGGVNACGLINTSSSSRRFTSVATSVTNETAYQISFWIKGTGQVRTGMYTGINASTGGYLTYNNYVAVTSSWTKVTQFLTSDGTVSVAEFIISLSSTSDVIIDDVEVTESTISNVTIYQIQNSTGDSPYINQVVNVYGIVTALHYSYEGGAYKGYFIQDGTGAFSGIYVYDQINTPTIGDYISVIANVTEYSGLTELTQISGFNLYSTNNYLPYPEEVTALQASGEEYEGVLIKIYTAKNTSSPTAYNDFTVNDGTSDINVDDDIYKFIPTLNSAYNITGIGHFAYNISKILPRSSDDVVLSYNLYISDKTACPYTSVSFSVSGSNISSVNWNFGDGYTGSYNYISHTYISIGTYPITATITDYNGSVTTLTDTVFIGNFYTPINYAILNVYNEPACPNSSLNFEAYGESNFTYLWNFGDGTSSTNIYPSHSYSQVGTYPVSVKLTNNCGTDTILYYTVHIVDNLPFSGNLYFSVSETTLCPNQSFSYSADTYGNSFVITFGDGTSSTQTYGYHSFSTVGTYSISLKATNGCGNDSTITRIIDVSSNTPVGYAYMDINNEPACPNSAVSFEASGEDINSYLWNFGDGTSSTSHYPSHSYSQVGTYPVSVKMTNYCGNDTILYYTVHIVDDLPFSGYLSLYLSENTVCPGQSFNYEFYVTGNNYLINFGDGTSSTQTNGSHTYSAIGTYTVSLTATNNCGNDSTITKTIIVNNNIPISYAYFNVYNEPACPNTFINLQASGEDINSYLWNFGDGTSSTSRYPSHSYSQVGTYPVSVKMTNFCGNDTILYYTVHIVDNLPYSGNLYLSLYENTICPTQSFSYYAEASVGNFEVNFGDGTSSSQYSGSHSYSSVGIYTVSLTATNGCGNDSTISKTIIVDDNMQIYNANIYVESEPSCPNSIINFYGSGIGAISYLWNFGDNTSSTSQHSTHSYSQTGTYTVSLKMTNYCENDTILYYTIHIENNIAYEGYIDLELYPFTYWGYEFGFDSVEVCPNQPVKYKGTTEEDFIINFGDGTTSTQLEGNHIYSALGTYTMTLTATNGCGNDSSVSVKVTVKDSLNFYKSNIQVSDSIVCPNTDIQFEAFVGDIPYSQAEILSMSISSYLWNFGDGTTSTDNNPEHSYSTSGNYSVSLKLTNYCGNDTTIYRNITIGGNLPYSDEIYLSIYSIEVCPNQSFDYYVYTEGNDFVVDFGDGTSSTQSYSTHSYTTIGTYTVTLTATNSCGNDTSVTRTIVVSNNVQVTTNYISVSSNSACPGDDVSFYVNNNYASYSWDFGDGTTSSGYNPAHQYDSLGIYDVNVTITNHCGNQKVLSTTVTISGDVQISNFGIYSNPDEICPGESVMFDAWLNQDVEYLWNFGDGSTSNLQNPQHTFNNAGTYNVVLTVSNSCGNQGSDSLTILVGNDIAPTAYDYEFGTIGNEFCTNDSVMFYVFPTGNSYLWDFGDSSSTTQTVEYLYNNYLLLDVAYHKYTQTGTYNVSLTLTNSCGNSFTEDFNITIGNDVPINGDIYYDNSNNYADEQIHFEAIGGSSYIWNFGDGTSTDTTTGNITEVYHVFANAGTYIVSVVISNECGNSDTVTTTIVINQSNSKEITSFTFASLDPDVIGVINQDDLTIQATVPFGTVVTSLSPTIVHTGVSISPTSAVAQDFTTPKTYIVTADNGTTKTYTVTVNIASSSASTQKAITSFSFQNFNPPVVATINETVKTINATVPYGSILTNLVATFTHTGESVIVNSVEQISGTTANDFSSSLNYTVIAEDASTATYSVNVVVTGIEELKAQLSINIYPNPNNGNFTLEIENANNKSISLQFFDISGRNIFNQKFENKAVLKENINVTGLESGIYLVKISDGEKYFYKRLLINR